MGKRIALASLLLATSAASARDFDFGTAVQLPAGTGVAGEWVDVADVNNDGRADLLGIEWPPHSQSPSAWYRRATVRLQRDDGTLAAPIVLALPLTQMDSITGADLENDGVNELIVGFEGGIIVYRWNGAEFIPSVHPSAFDCRLIAIGDLEGNGTRDIVCQSLQYTASIFNVDPSGQVSAPSYMATNSTALYNSYRQLKLADVTNDGRLDLLYIDSGVWSFQVYENNGAGGFYPARAFNFPREYLGMAANAIEAFDVDGDGRNEIIVPMAQRLLMYKRDSTGTFRLWKLHGTFDNADSLAKHDVDHDGYLDLLVAYRGARRVGRFMGTGTGLSATESIEHYSALGLDSGTWVALGDLNGDGRTDMATNSYVWTHVVNYGMGKRENDLTGEYESDLFWRNATTGQNGFWPYAAGPERTLANVAAPWEVATIADFDNDDKADVFWRNPTNGANMIWRSGDATTLLPTVPLAADWKVVGSGDFDGDHKYDVLWRNAKNGANGIWLAGQNTPPRPVTAVLDLRWQVAGVGDFDGDGRDDILWRHSASGQNSIWFSADATAGVVITAVPNLSWKVAGIGDFNRDGMDDILWRNAANGLNTIWRSGNSARSQAVTGMAAPNWIVAAIGDYYSDAADDIVWRNVATGENVIWETANSATTKTLNTRAGTEWKVVP